MAHQGGVFSGEHIGVEYLGTQSDTLAEKEPEREFDGAFKNYESAKTDVVEDTKVQDLTLSLSEDSLDSDSGTEDDSNTAVNYACVPGWDRVIRLANALPQRTREDFRTQKKRFSHIGVESMARFHSQSNVILLDKDDDLSDMINKGIEADNDDVAEQEEDICHEDPLGKMIII
ncbi:hypothetical protein AWC38_SpisGene11502 [Stylophora pistillata]|uniref:Uncharacterized protein n=1 Tax=Stylophora pistillata TaxID=50429 RepID=A0A2B4S5W2_STYPI|nr:hypothetical protein AWC38_SpisGene11502 [Stylophora pistillata]